MINLIFYETNEAIGGDLNNSPPDFWIPYKNKVYYYCSPKRWQIFRSSYTCNQYRLTFESCTKNMVSIYEIHVLNWGDIT